MGEANEDELETHIGQWTMNFDRDELVNMLQQAGVPSGPVQDVPIRGPNPQLRERKSFVKLTHPVIGECNHPAPSVKLSKSPAQVRTSPCRPA